MSGDFLNQTTYQAGIIQSQAYRALFGFVNDRLKPHALTHSEWKMLGLINDCGVLKTSEVAVALNIRRPIVSRVLKELETKHLIRRVIDKTDSRIIMVKLTKKGTQKVNMVEKYLRKEMKQFLSGISLKDLNVYLKVLDKMSKKV